ncbi:hypothetical protein KKH23_04570 [Patescibacteria group bacterium]|nr:hypothetical protein [Patescibacteria group bacterium]MBU0846440.1 hypothetical protein [Patescibacteria group bacterium]
MKLHRKTLTLVLLAILVSALIPIPALAQTTVTTDKPVYAPNELVTVSGEADANAWVTIEIKDPDDIRLHFDTVQADGLGAYESFYGLAIDAMEGTYTVYASTGIMVSTTFIVGEAAPDFGISVSPVSGSVAKGGSTSATVTVTTIEAYAQLVTLIASGQPAGVTVSLVPTSGTPSFTSTMTITVSAAASAGTYPITITGTGADDKIHTKTYTLTVTEIPTGDTGTLSIDTIPAGGAVFVNYESWGVNPQPRVVAVGEYTVSFGAKAGYITPSPVSATVYKDIETTITGIYTYVAPTTGFSIDYVSSTVVDQGDVITVMGSGVTSGTDVKIYWDYIRVDQWLNTTEGDPDGTFECEIEIPSDIAGTHYLWGRDTSTGETTSYGPIIMVPKIKMSPSSGLVKDKITIKGYGFSEEEDIVTITFDGDALPTTPTVPETDELGYWSASFKVPTDLTYGDYTVYAIDDDGVSTTKDFTVGASIELDVDEGPVGTVLEISGRGFTEAIEITAGMITIDGTSCYVTDEDTVDDGEFKIEVVIPSVTKKDEYTITVDDGTLEAEADFEVTGLAEITLDPEYGVQGTSVVINGYNFTAISGEEVSLELWNSDGSEWITDIKDFDTGSDGEFDGKFTIPARSSGVYTIKAVQADYNIEGDENFRIGMMLVIVTPSSGPTGTMLTLTGTGFSEGDNWNATFGDLAIIEGDDGDVDGDSNLELDGGIPTVYVPTLPVGVYTITIMDIETEIEVEADFKVTETTTVDLDPVVSPNDYNITITGKYFSADEGASIDFVLYNVTADGKTDEDWDMRVRQSYNEGTSERSAKLDEDGNFTAWWVVPDSDTLSRGAYMINATDDNDLFVQIPFSVVAKTTDINTRKGTFRIGDNVGFNIESSFAQDDSYIKIWAPGSELYWTTDDFAADVWQKVGTIEIVPFYEQTAGGNQMVLLDDAPLGTWTWKWYDFTDDELDSGVFNVAASEAEVFGEQIDDLNQAINDLTSDISGVTDAIAGVQTNVNSAIQAANAAVEAANAAVDAVNAVAGVAGDAAEAADRAAEAAGKAQDAAGNLSTLVYGAIGASLVAALAAIVSLMQISKRIAG